MTSKEPIALKFSEIREYILADEPDGEISFWLSPDGDEGQAEPLLFGASFDGKVFFERLPQDSVSQKRREPDVSGERGIAMHASLPAMQLDHTETLEEHQAHPNVQPDAVASEPEGHGTQRSVPGGPNMLSDKEPTDLGLLFFIRNYDCKTNDPKDRFRSAGCQEDYYALRREMINSLADAEIAEIRNDQYGGSEMLPPKYESSSTLEQS